MKRSKGRTRKFLVDTNAFVSAIKKPGKALELLLRLLGKEFNLVANPYLVDEYTRYSRELPSDVARFLMAELCSRLRVVEVAERFVRLCKPYFQPGEAVDILIAATCLQEGAVLITNDKHFTEIMEEGVIEVWSISDAIDELLRN